MFSLKDFVKSGLLKAVGKMVLINSRLYFLYIGFNKYALFKPPRGIKYHLIKQYAVKEVISEEAEVTEEVTE